MSLASLLFDAPHALAVQSYAPRDMRGGGRVNADGFGVGWHTPTGPVRYRRAVPIWADAGFGEIAGLTTSGAILAAVRNATVGMPITETAAAPFLDDRWLFSLNGRIDGWPASAVKLAETLATEELLTLDAPTDAALLWAVLRQRLRAGRAVEDVLREVVAQTLMSAPESRLNLLLTDGHTGWATTVTHSLWVRMGPAVLASEPLDDDPAWQPVPEHSLIRLERDQLSISPLNM